MNNKIVWLDCYWALVVFEWHFHMFFELQPYLIAPKTQILVVNVEICNVTNLLKEALHLTTLGNVGEWQLIVLNQLMVHNGGLWNTTIYAPIHFALIPIEDHNS